MSGTASSSSAAEARQDRTPEPDDGEAAAAWLEGWVVRTPVLRSAVLDRIAWADLWLTAENLQYGGCYVLRAAAQVARDGQAD